MPMLGKSGIMWATTLKPASLARWKDSETALTVWPLRLGDGIYIYIYRSNNSLIHVGTC